MIETYEGMPILYWTVLSAELDEMPELESEAAARELAATLDPEGLVAPVCDVWTVT